jgi:glycine oxidase
MLAPAAEADVELPGIVDLRRRSRALYPEFIADVETRTGVRCDFRTDGTLLVALDADDAAELERLRVIVAEQDFAVRPLDADTVLAFEPHLVSRVRGGLLLEDDAHVDQRVLMSALIKALGPRWIPNAEVLEVEPSGTIRGTRAGGSAFALAADQVVLAAGSWTHLGLRSPFATLPLRPVKGQSLLLRGPRLLQRVLRTPQVYLVPRGGEAMILGATVEEQGFDAAPTAGAALDLLRFAWRALPGIYDLELAEHCVGMRPAARDHLPVIGRAADARVVVATGHFRNGILLAPLTARIVADLVCDERRDPALEWLGPERFARPAHAGGVHV